MALNPTHAIGKAYKVAEELTNASSQEGLIEAERLKIPSVLTSTWKQGENEAWKARVIIVKE